MKRPMLSGIVFVLVAALLWGTTGTVAAMAPGVGPLAIGAAAMGIGGLLQAAAASRVMFTHRGGLTAEWRTVMLSAGAVAVFPLAFYSSMRLAGVAAGTVVSIGSAPPAAAVIERIAGHQPLSRGWALGTTAGVSGVLALALAHPGEPGPATTTAAAQPVLGITLGLLAGLTYALYSWGAARVMRCGLPSRPVMGAVFGPMFLGYILFGHGLATVPASTATTVSLLEPAVAALLAVIVLREHLPPTGWLGLGLLSASLVITATSTRPTATSRPGNRPAEAPDHAVPVTVNADAEARMRHSHH